jgi:signal transduction histidine kinase
MKSWLFMGALLVLCAVLGVLQYEWIGEFSAALGHRFRAALEVNLAQLNQDLNGEIGSACRALIPSGVEDAAAARAELERRYELVRKSASGARLFRRVAIAEPRDGSATPMLLDFSTGKVTAAEWPEEWEPMRRWIGSRSMPPPFSAPGPGGRGGWEPADGLLLEAPLFVPGLSGRGGPGRGFGRREFAWVILELNSDYIRDTMLPEVVQRHLDITEYDVEVRSRTRPPATVWRSGPQASGIASSADAAIGVLDIRIGGFGEGGRGRPGRGGGARGPESGRWTLFVRHKAGSLDAVVAQTRWKNIGVTAGVLLLLMATVWALFRYTRNAQRLAHMQMDFVAGVSHELRTPLTAIYTAGHNLRGRVAQNPAQVERYGEMIQQESGRLRDLVEQVLRFAGANAGRVIQEPTPVSVAGLIEETLESSRCAMQAAHCTIEKRIDDGLPEILADPMAMKQALQNLLVNAVKYGAKDDPWIGVSATALPDGVEIRVADRGPGIPEEEQKHIFDAFFRGRRAVQDQVHGAGLGLNLVKKIVEAHKGSIRLKSAPGEGAEFIVRLPAAPAGARA